MKIFGVPTRIEGSFFVLTAFLAFGRMSEPLLLAEWVLVVLLSIFLHELGHALAAKSFGLSPAIKLYSMGGVTYWPHEEETTPPKHLIISLAGPATGLLIGALVFALRPFFLREAAAGPLAVAYHDVLWVNVGWGLFNLLPILPLDGGNVMRSLEEWVSKRKEQFYSYFVSFLVALSVAIYAASVRRVWIVFLAGLFAYTNGSFLLRRLRTHRDRRLYASLDEAREALRGEEYGAASRISGGILGKAKSEALRREAARLLVYASIHEGDYEKAEAELRRLQVVHGSDPYLEGMLLIEKGDAAQAIPVLESAFDSAPTEQLGLILNHALLLEGRFGEALSLSAHPSLAEVRRSLLLNLQTEAFQHGAFEFSRRAGELAYEDGRDASVAYNVSCAFARDSRVAASLEWLERAVDDGFSDREALASDPDLDSIRGLAEFERIAGKLGDAAAP